ncbi:MAG: thiamine-phosphate kinase [Acidobacteria bacterium]|nr:thiamine-phosphate kinase [Acidobacteriota bacterium]
MPSEFDFIREIQQKAAAQSAADLVLGIGDDAAIWREQSGRESLITVDLLVEDVDFKLEYAPPRWLGHKALAVSLSDIAAMGAAPKFSLLTLAIPQSAIRNPQFWQEFFEGYFELAAKHGVALIGGDISSAPDRLTIDSVVIGHCQTGKAVRRDGAKIGNAIYVAGSIGASAVGLKLLLGGERVGDDVRSSAFRRSRLQPPKGGTTNAIQSAIRAHLKPEPRVEFGRRLGELGLVSSMIDVSDGLAQDLSHICEASSVGALIEFEAVPIAGEVGLILSNADEAFEFAVSGGEDFELLFTADQNREAELMALAGECQLRLTRIGEVVERSLPVAVLIQRDGKVKHLSIRGYDHFGV